MKATNHPSDKMTIKNNNGDLLLEIDAEGVQSIKFKDGNEITGEDISSAIGKAGNLPATTSADAGKALVVDEEGKIVTGEAGGGSSGYSIEYVQIADDQTINLDPEYPTVYVVALNSSYENIPQYKINVLRVVVGDNTYDLVVNNTNNPESGYSFDSYDLTVPVSLDSNTDITMASIYESNLELTTNSENPTASFNHVKVFAGVITLNKEFTAAVRQAMSVAK